MEEFAIYRDYQRAFLILEDNRVNQFSRQYDKDDMGGFKIMFPIDEPLPKENEDLEF